MHLLCKEGTTSKGEVPSILEHSTMGKVVFPYALCVCYATERLRRTLNRDGAVGT